MVDQQGFRIDTMTSDNESAFTSYLYKDELKDNDITPEYIETTSPSRHKSLAFVDRFCRTLRNLIEHYMDARNTNKWADVIDDLVENYNTSVHSSLGKSPQEAIRDPVDETAIYQEVRRTRKTAKASKQTWNRPDIEVGSRVRYLVPSVQFSKKTKPKWSRALYC